MKGNGAAAKAIDGFVESGTGTADASSMRAAIELALELGGRPSTLRDS